MQGLGILDELLFDDAVTEIMVNGHQRVYVEKQGVIRLTDKQFNDEQELLAIVHSIVKPLGKSVSDAVPCADARLPDGSRVHIMLPPLSLNGPMLTIRKFPKNRITGNDLINLGSLNSNMLAFLRLCVESRRNIVISGGTGSGKTSLLNVLSSFIPEHERIITLEDTAELRLDQEHVGRLEARAPDGEGKNGFSIRQLLINALRMRPDRIIVGECRGGEALDMVQAMNTGHAGSLTTLHANSARDCLKRLEVMVLMSGFDLPIRATREQLASALHLIVQVSRFPDGSRKVTGITEVTGMEGEIITLSSLFEFKSKGYDSATEKCCGDFVATHNIPSFIQDMKAQNTPVDMSIFQ